jgi:polysaccharide deacetylase family protein (PEP-CTERM system associated)
MNALTIDVEDWYHVCGTRRAPFIPPGDTGRVQQNLEKILRLLQDYDQRATFFVLGSVAQNNPALAPMIAEAGHEIASHGFSHQLVTELSPEQFRSELKLTEEILFSQTGRRPVGFRAPQWSLSKDMPWAFAILREEGYLYDSSLNPLPFIGNRNGSRVPSLLKDQIMEFPPMVTPSFWGNLPTGGGWGFRFFPYRMISNTIEALNKMKQPAVLYIHPRELDPSGPRLELNPLKRFVSYGSRADVTPRLKELLQRYRFTTLQELATLCRPAS